MTIGQQAELWMQWLGTRKRSPAKLGSLHTYRSYLNRWIIPQVGDQDIATFGNAKMRSFVSLLSSSGKLKSKSIFEIAGALKQIIGSALDDEGTPLYQVRWNNEFIDLPLVNSAQQKSPAASRSQVEKATRHPGQYGLFYIVLAATGMRLGEALALRIGEDGTHTGWSPENRSISVKTAFWRGVEQSPKTAAGVRIIDLPARLNDYLIEHCAGREAGQLMFMNATGRGPMHRSTLHKFSLKKTGIEGFHAFRRFRISHLREFGTPEDLIKFWAGHAGQGITDRYSKLAQNLELRKSWIERAGLGFDLPKRRENDEQRSVLRTVSEALRTEVCDVPSGGEEVVASGVGA